MKAKDVVPIMLFHLIITTFTALFICTVYLTHKTYFRYYFSSQKYVSTNRDLLANQIFDTVFEQGQLCRLQRNTALKESCEQDVASSLADVLKQANRPIEMDFIFVKSIGDKFFSLDQNGKVKDATPLMTSTPADTRLAFFLRSALHKCDYFNVFVKNEDFNSCEQYFPLNLSDGNTGYVVHQYPLEDSKEVAKNFLYYLFANFPSQESLGILAFSLSSSTILTYIFVRKNSK